MGGWTNPITRLTADSSGAPLSTLLPAPPPSYEGTIKPGVDSPSKLQYGADILGKAGSESIGAGTSLLGKPLDYWQKVLEPPTRQGILEETGPVASSIVGQYSTGKKAIERGPRGGGTTSTLANLPFQEAGDITSLLERQLSQKLNVLQPGAAQAITGIAESLSGLGLAEMGINAQQLSTLISAAVAKRGQTAEMLGSLGKGIGSIVAALI